MIFETENEKREIVSLLAIQGNPCEFAWSIKMVFHNLSIERITPMTKQYLTGETL